MYLRRAGQRACRNSAGRPDALLQDLALGRLRVAKVHHLVKPARRGQLRILEGPVASCSQLVAADKGKGVSVRVTRSGLARGLERRT